MMLGAKRAKYYSALDLWEPILKTPGVTFVNLQYGDSEADIARVKKRVGIDIHVMDVDLKDDIDGAAALSSALDLVISAPTAAAANAGAVGTEVWFVTAGRTWPQFGTDEYPWYRKSHVYSPGEVRRLERADAGVSQRARGLCIQASGLIARPPRSLLLLLLLLLVEDVFRH